MTETLFTDILERIRPGYKVGGVITTPKRGLVNEAGSYAGIKTDLKNLTTPRENLKRLAEIIQQADIDDELEYLMATPEEQLKMAKRLGRKKIVRHKKGKMTAALRQDFNRLRTDENSIRMVANLLGEDVEYVLDVVDEAENFSGEAKLKAMMSGSRIKEKDTRAKFEKIEKWMTSNAKRFDDPTDLKKAINKRFGSNNILNQTAKKKGIPLFTQGFTNEILGSKGFSGDTSRFTNTLLDNVYKTTIYNFNPKVRKQLTKEITNVLSGGPAKVTEEARTKIKNNPLLKKFGFDQQINGPIAKLLFKEIGEDMYKNIQTFKQPRIGTDGLLKYLANEVNPKYKSMFMEAGRAIKAFQDRDRDGAAKFLKKGTRIMYDHKIPVSLIKNGYADEIEYVKITPTSEYFNAEIKNRQFDQPVNNLLRKYEQATGPQKNILFNEILNKKNDFSKNYRGYLDDVSITKDKVGKIKFSTSKKTPIFTKDTNILKEFAKSSLQTGELNKKQVKTLLADSYYKEMLENYEKNFDSLSPRDKMPMYQNATKKRMRSMAKLYAKYGKEVVDDVMQKNSINLNDLTKPGSTSDRRRSLERKIKRGSPSLKSDPFGIGTAIEKGPSALKKLGSLGARGLTKALYPAGIALEGYFMNEARKQGKTAAEILAMPFLLEGRVAEAQDMLKLTPVERQAYNRANIEQDDSLLDTDFYTPNLEGIESIDNEASKKYLRQSRALEEALRAQERAAPKQRFTLPNITGIIEDEV